MKKALHTHLIGFAVICSTLLFTSCDAHDDHDLQVETTMHLCDVVCSDGTVVRYDDYKARNKTASAVVFHINADGKGQGKAYAVCLYDIESTAFSDTLGIKQNTSANIIAHDGNTNSFTLLANKKIYSPMANMVFQYMDYGQSAYIPSVAQLQLLHAARNTVNSYISRCGGDIIPDNPNECWYWSSTEVSGQESAKAWLFSLASGALQETPKYESHKIRPIITLYH